MDSDSIKNLEEEYSSISSDAILAILFGLCGIIVCMYCMLKSAAIRINFGDLARRYPVLNHFFGENQAEPGQERRIHSDECSICFMPITNEVGAACGHIFCGIKFVFVEFDRKMYY